MTTKKAVTKVVVHYNDGTQRKLSNAETRLVFPREFIYRPSKKLQRLAAAHKLRKLTPKVIQKIVEQYAARVEAGKRYGALKELAHKWNVSTTHIRNVLKKQGAFKAQ